MKKRYYEMFEKYPMTKMPVNLNFDIILSELH